MAMDDITESDLGINEKRPIRIGWGILLFGAFFFMIWAVSAPIDEGVPAPATVNLETKRKAVQHPSGGVVKQIFVKEAQFVKEGDPLLQLEETYAHSNYEALHKQYLGSRAVESRLLAEEQGKETIEFHPDLLAEREDPVIASFMAAEAELFEARRAAIQNQTAILTENSHATMEQMKGVTAQLEGRKRQLALVQQQLIGTKDLAKEGYLPRNKQIEEERGETDLQTAISSLQANLAQQGRTLGETKLRIIQIKKEQRRDINTQMSSTKRDLETTFERMLSAKLDLERTIVRSPASGFVIGLTIQTVGGVIGGGSKLMEIVPEHERLLLEAQLPLMMIDRVYPGLPVDVRCSAFTDLPYLVIDGEVVTVSADRMDAPSPMAPPYYLVRVEVTQEGLRKLGYRRLLPGMSAEILIKTGKRTFLNYLLRPFSRRLSAAFTEK